MFLICVYRNEQRFIVFYRKILRVLTRALNHLPALVFYTVVLLCRPIAPPLQLSYSPSPYPSPWQPLTRSVSTVYLLSECHRLTTFAKHLLSLNIVTWELIRLCWLAGSPLQIAEQYSRGWTLHPCACGRISWAALCSQQVLSFAGELITASTCKFFNAQNHSCHLGTYLGDLITGFWGKTMINSVRSCQITFKVALSFYSLSSSQENNSQRKSCVCVCVWICIYIHIHGSTYRETSRCLFSWLSGSISYQPDVRPVSVMSS